MCCVIFIVLLLLRSFARPSVRSFAGSLVRPSVRLLPFARSIVRSFVPSLVRSFARLSVRSSSFARSLVRPFVPSLARSFARSSVHSSLSPRTLRVEVNGLGSRPLTQHDGRWAGGVYLQLPSGASSAQRNLSCLSPTVADMPRLSRSLPIILPPWLDAFSTKSGLLCSSRY